jgi:hypothetical protein
MKGQGDFLQRTDSMVTRMQKYKLVFNKHAIFLRKKIFSKNFENSPDLEVICAKEKEAEKSFDNIISIISEFNKIFKKIK